MNRRRFITNASAGMAFLQAQTDEGGFASMFDGITLNGWSIQDGPESAFYVADGSIVVHESGGYPAWLRTDKQFENFDFRCEFFI